MKEWKSPSTYVSCRFINCTHIYTEREYMLIKEHFFKTEMCSYTWVQRYLLKFQYIAVWSIISHPTLKCVPVFAIYRSRRSESRSLMSDTLRPHGLYSPWNSPRQNTGVDSLSLLQGIFPTQGSYPGLHTAGIFFTIWATRGAQEYWSG